MVTAGESAKSATEGTKERTPIVVDMGSQRRSRVRQLRQGRGRLMEEVSTLLNELRVDGAISASAQPVVVVVRERSARTLLWPLTR